MTPPKIFISAGETSGDFLGASLARALHQRNPQLVLTGMGGKQMQDAGVAIQFDAEKLSVVGISEVITHLPGILSTWRAIKKYFADEKPDLIIFIDFPDTHCHLMKAAKKYGIPVLYYVSPQIWAWRYHRIKKIKKYVDHMAVLFAFEEKIYQAEKIPVTFVGHQLGTTVKPTMTKNAAYDFFALNADQPIVSLFPGSRHGELKSHLPVMIDSVTKIAAQNPATQFVLVLARHFDETVVRAMLPAHIKIARDHLYDLLQISTAAIAVSGTITLEIALMQVPLCIIYKMKPLTYWLAKKLIRLKNIGLCNIVAEKPIAKEFIQENASTENISREIIRLIEDKSYHAKIAAEFADIKNKICVQDKSASDIVANIVFEKFL